MALILRRDRLRHDFCARARPWASLQIIRIFLLLKLAKKKKLARRRRVILYRVNIDFSNKNFKEKERTGFSLSLRLYIK